MAEFLPVITAEEIEVLRAARRSGAVHPLANLALAARAQPGKPAYVAAATELAGRLVFAKNPGWLRGLRSRLLATDDFSHASSALGEIRAYGDLLETWMDVRPGPTVLGSKVSPEFAVDAGDGEIIVEVHSRQLDNDETAKLDAHADDVAARHADAVAAGPQDGRSNVVTMGTTEVFPTGAPDPTKEGDTVATNTISRIAAIKQNEKQVDSAKPFVLWLDLQDPGVWGFPISDDQFAPLYTEMREGYAGCGAFWYALYGRRGDALLESRGYRYASRPLGHDGRFFQTMRSHGGPSRVSAVVFSMPRSVVLMENPNAVRRIPDRARAAFLKVPTFRLDMSVMDWRPGLASTIVEASRQAAEAAIEKLEAFDASA